MEFINRTPYDLDTIKAAFYAAWEESFGPDVATPAGLQLYVLGPKDHAPKSLVHGDSMIVRLPELTGSEWVHLLKQQQGIESTPPDDEGPPFVWEVLRSLLQLFRAANAGDILHLERVVTLHKLPRLLPLTNLKEVSDARDQPDRV
jgi:hypothetical protein